jgi:hypothetical protein
MFKGITKLHPTTPLTTILQPIRMLTLTPELKELLRQAIQIRIPRVATPTATQLPIPTLMFRPLIRQHPLTSAPPIETGNRAKGVVIKKGLTPLFYSPIRTKAPQ